MPVGPGEYVEFQMPVLVGYGGRDEDPVPTSEVELVEFQTPVLE